MKVQEFISTINTDTYITLLNMAIYKGLSEEDAHLYAVNTIKRVYKDK